MCSKAAPTTYHLRPPHEQATWVVNTPPSGLISRYDRNVGASHICPHNYHQAFTRCNRMGTRGREAVCSKQTQDLRADYYHQSSHYDVNVKNYQSRRREDSFSSESFDLFPTEAFDRVPLTARKTNEIQKTFRPCRRQQSVKNEVGEVDGKGNKTNKEKTKEKINITNKDEGRHRKQRERSHATPSNAAASLFSPPTRPPKPRTKQPASGFQDAISKARSSGRRRELATHQDDRVVVLNPIENIESKMSGRQRARRPMRTEFDSNKATNISTDT